MGIRLVRVIGRRQPARRGLARAARLLGRRLHRNTRNARAWAGQAENPPKPQWAFGWFVHFLVDSRFVNHTTHANHDEAWRKQLPCRLYAGSDPIRARIRKPFIKSTLANSMRALSILGRPAELRISACGMSNCLRLFRQAISRRGSASMDATRPCTPAAESAPRKKNRSRLSRRPRLLVKRFNLSW
jgi:hypothetical protein